MEARTPMKLPILALGALLGLLFLPGGCTQTLTQPQLDGRTPMVRVRIVEAAPDATLTASHPPTVSVSSNNTLRRLNVAPGTPVRVALAGNSWRIGNADVGHGILTIDPAYDGTVAINGSAYRGRYRLVPTSDGRFDVVNDVDIDSYLKSVVSKELYARWHPETYRAQAIIARTYALYESKTTNEGKHFDLHADQRSQVYGGINAETDKSREAVEATAGVVVAAGRQGQERIFKAYFSSACGGVSQTATDAFGDRPNAVFREQSDQGLCSGSPKYNWGPVVLPKAEVTRRLKAWGKAKGNPVQSMKMLSRIDIEPNPLGRPVRFYLTDSSETRFMLRSEEMRHSMNFAAPNDATSLPSSFFKIVNDPANIHFVEGHGHGHGVGMCQWASQRRAEQGMRHEDIVLVAYPGSVLVRAY
jgi:stage II sporulation protein D